MCSVTQPRSFIAGGGAQLALDAACVRKATDRRSVSGGEITCAGTYLLFRTQMSGACGRRGVEINTVWSAEQHADFRFHRACDELVVISFADLFFFF